MMNPNQAQFGGSFQQPQQPQQKGCVGRNWKWALPVGCLGLILICVAGGAGIFYFAMSTLKSSEVYKGALERARSNPAAAEALGGLPIKDGWLVQGNVNFSGGSGTANLQIPVSGPKRSGTLVVRAIYENGAWMYENLDLAVEGGGVIPLLDRGSKPEGESLEGGEEDSDENDPSMRTDNGGVVDGQPAPPAPAERNPVEIVISGGVLNGKATSKPQPPYPPVAKAARASGTVNVQVTVDEEGNVIQAAAVSGHPLLQAAAVAAARQAKFTPTLLSGRPVKVKGILTYNFVLEPQ